MQEHSLQETADCNDLLAAVPSQQTAVHTRMALLIRRGMIIDNDIVTEAGGRKETKKAAARVITT